MSDLVITIISSIAIATLFIIAFVIIKKKITKLGKTIVAFFLPVYCVSWVLYFCAVFTNDTGLPLYMKIMQVTIISLKSFALDLNINTILVLAKSNLVYSIALCCCWFLSCLNTLYLIILIFAAGFKEKIRVSHIKKNPHYIVILDNLNDLDSIDNLDMPSIVLLDNTIDLKNNSRKYSNKQITFVFNNDKKEALIKAGIKYKGVIILSLSKDKDVNLTFLNYANDILPEYNKTFINYDFLDVTAYFDEKKNINIYNLEDLIARDFIQKYPLYEQINPKLIDYSKAMVKSNKINHFFLGYNKISRTLMTYIIHNYQMVNGDLNIYLCDEFASDCIDSFNGKHFVNKEVSDLIDNGYSRDEYFELAKCNFKFHSLPYKYESYDLKKQILNNIGDYPIFYIDYNDDRINFEAALELDSFLRYSRVINYKIYVRFEKDSKINITELNSKNISTYGESKSIISKRVIIDQSLDFLAKRVNYFYYLMNVKDNKTDIDSLWDNLSIIDKNSNRFAALNIPVKLNLMGLKLTKDSNKAISKDEYLGIYNNSKELVRDLNMVNYDYSNPRINLGILEHYRWNTYQLMFNVRPMKKCDIFKDNKYINKDKINKEHSNILSLEGLFDLENTIAECEFLSLEDRNSKSKIFIKDFDLMDNLFEILNDSKVYITKI